jgi:hypothetical protein
MRPWRVRETVGRNVDSLSAAVPLQARRKHDTSSRGEVLLIAFGLIGTVSNLHCGSRELI